MKKTLVFVAGLLLAGMMQAQNQTQIDGVWYLLDSENKTATVTFCPSDDHEGWAAESGYYGKLNIPATVASEATGYAEYAVTAIGDSAFAKCPYLTGLTIPASVKTLGVSLMKDFYKDGYGEGISELTIADSDEPLIVDITSLEEIAYTCTYLYLGRGVKSKEESDMPVFHTWNLVQDVVLGESLTEIPPVFCPYCRDLKSIQINSEEVLEPSVRMFGWLDEDNPKPDATTITLYVPYGMKKTYAANEYWSRFTIEEMDDARRYGIKYVDGYFDFYINGLYYKRTDRGVSIVIPQVWYINHDGSYVSQWSSEFPYRQKEIDIPSQITLYLKDYTDYSLTPQEGYEKSTFDVAGIGDYCFRGARNLERLTIPNTVAEVGTEAFEDAMQLKSLDIPESVIHVGWLAFARAGFEEITLPVSQSQWESDAAFQDCINLRKAVFKQGTTHIQDRIFFGCEALRVIDIPDGVVEIGAGAFAGCSALQNLRLPDGLLTIRNRTFRGCPLRSLEIPATVEEIEGSAFLAVPLSCLTVKPGNKTFDSRDNCNAIIRTKDNTLVAACNGSFIPESVDSIASESFVELDGIRSISLPKNLKRINPQGLMNLNNLTLITSYIENPAGVLREDAISGWWEEQIPQVQATLYVPAGTKALYQADSEWSKFQNIVEMTGTNKPADVADLQPLQEEGTADLGKITDDTDLTNAIVDNMYITCDTTNGDNYDKTEKALVLNTVMDQLMLDNVLANEGNMDILRNNFSGIVIEVPAGKGTISIEAKVTGEHALAVFISGTEEALTYDPTTKTQIEVPYETAKNALVYLYGILRPGDQSAVPHRAPSKILRASQAGENENETNNVTVYGISWNVTETINGIENADIDEDNSIRKIVLNGQIFIMRDGKIYTPAGMVVR